jgi:multidrug resistance efflux pump
MREHNAVSPLEVAISGAEVDQARADVALWEARINHCSIRAPFPGRVAKVVAKPYETVTQGAPLLEVLDDRELTMELHVPSNWVSWLKSGSGFQVSIDETGKTYAATVTGLGARVDPVSQTLQVNAVIDGRHDELLAGMSGIARFPVPQ